MSKNLGGGVASIRELMSGLWRHLTRRRKQQFVALAFLMVLSALAETLSLGIIIPFLGALADPEAVLSHPLVASMAPWLGINAAEQLPIPLAIIFASIAILSAAIRMLLLWVNTRLSYAVGGDFSVACYLRTLHQPYQVHISRNSSVVLSAIAKKVGIAIAVLYQLTMLLSSLVLSGAVITTLIFIDWRIALFAGSGFACLYLLIVRYARRTLYENSIWIARQEDRAVQVLQEGLGGVRDVLLDGVQAAYSGKYADIVYVLRQAQATNVFLAGAPRYLLEASGMVIIAGMAGVLAAEGGKAAFAAAFPALGAFALGAQRLLPTMQQMYAAWAGVIGNHGAVTDVLEMLDQRLPATLGSADSSEKPLPISRICLNKVGYRYAPDAPWVLQDINLAIDRGCRLGVVGGTGSGKSTLLDIIMALLQPTAGELRINDTTIGDLNASSWQRRIAHVPQHIFLADASIAENIAFGVPKEKIDFERLRWAAQLAQIAEFIEARPEGYSSYVGERGVRLSGGRSNV